MQKYYPPRHSEKAFNCVQCQVYALQRWEVFYYKLDYNINYRQYEDLMYCICSHCNKWSIWYKGRMIVPSETSVPPAHVDMPSECRADYEEARNVVAISPRSAAALLRLALQKLMIVLGEKGKNLNEDIGKLVKKGLAPQVQQVWDYCRVVGNNAVHPSEIQIDGTPEIAYKLFEMMNFIIEHMIARPKQIEALFSGLPETAIKQIEARDQIENRLPTPLQN